MKDDTSQQASKNTAPIPVVALVLRDDRGRVLVQQRAAEKHQGGLWEFPGGKAEPGESAQAALGREILEELGYDLNQSPQSPVPLIRLTHHYPDKSVALDVYELTDPEAAKRVYAREGQPLKWISLDELSALEMPAADRPIVQAIRLPDYYWITPGLASSPSSIHKASPQAMEKWLAEARTRLQNGVPLVQFRSKTVPAASRALVLKALRGWCQENNVPLIYNGDLAQGKAMLEYGIVDGLHLDSRQLMACQNRPVDASAWLSASAHNAQELRQAEKLGVDFVSLSPVHATPSHPEAQTLGWEGFSRLTEKTCLPVFALGGMTVKDRKTVRRHGGQGVAGIRLEQE